MRYYQCEKYPIEFVLSENIDKCFDCHNHVGNYVISLVMQELSIETLAADIFVSKYYLIRKFRNSVGMTPHQFCIQNRIRKSQRLLDEEKTISRIAAEMGFYDQSHFDKAFQKIVGISPSEYIHSKKQIGQST